MSAPRWLRETAWLGVGLLVAAVITVVVLFGMTQTDRGRAYVLRLTLAKLSPGIQGSLRVGEMRGNLLTGAKLYGVALRDAAGEPFLLADSAYLDYDPRTLTTRRIHIDDAVIYNGRVFVSRMPGDTLWNYQKIFADTSANKRAREERYTFLDRVRIVNGYTRVQLPWLPDSTAAPAEQRAEVREVLADTSPLIVKRVPGGFLQTVELRRLNGRVSRVRFAPGTRNGTYAAVDTLSGNVKYYRTPFDVRNVKGDLAVLADRFEYRMPYGVMNSSPLSSQGIVRPGGGPDGQTAYDVVFRSDSVRFADLRWLYRKFPSQARGSMSLLIETRPEGTLFLGREMRIQAQGTRLQGSFGMIVGDTIRFVDVNLRARPFRLATIEGMLPSKIPVRGLRIEGVEIRGSGSAPDRTATLTAR